MSLPGIDELTSNFDSSSPYVCHKESYMGKLGDKRLDKRADQLSKLLFLRGSSSIHESTPDEASQKAAYRFLSNPNVEEARLIDVALDKSRYLCTDRDLLVLQDTTEFDLDNNRNRLQKGSGIGLTGNNKNYGFFCHCSLVLDYSSETLIGYSDIQIWHRPEDHPEKVVRDYNKLPIEEKESYKWTSGCLQGKRHLAQARSITFVEDREGDIYEQFEKIPDDKTHLIVRSRDNRRLADNSKLHEKLAEQAVGGQYKIDIVQDIRQGVEKREATVEVRYCEVEILKPVKLKKEGIKASVKLYAVEVREVNAPAGVVPVLWRILTTHKITSYEEAISIVNKYRLRWYIEQLFRLLKKKGFKVESSQLETGWAIRKLTIMLMSSALRVMQLLLAYKKPDSQPIEEGFSEKEIVCMGAINKKLQGSTEKSTNTNNPKQMAWATWVIARLGGWKNYNSKRPPGPIILKKGLDKFNAMFEGWELAQSG